MAIFRQLHWTACVEREKQVNIRAIFTAVTVKLPCSALSFETASFVSSFMLCIAALETTPVAVTVCPTCSARVTLSLLTSQVLPSLALRTNSLGLSPCDRQPVTSLTSFFESPASADILAARMKHSKTSLLIGSSFGTFDNELL